MTLLDAKQYDPARDRKRVRLITIAVFVVLALAWLGYHLRDYGARAVADKFLAALQQQNYEAAYSIWFHDPAWKQHAGQYSNYPFNEFYRDWGPASEWGAIKSYKVDCSLSPSGGSGVIVQVTVNQRTQHAYIWVQRSDKTLSFSPNDIECGNWWAWVTE